MVRTSRWKYFFYKDHEEFLYDMEDDPDEEHNLAHDPTRKALVAELKQKASADWVMPPAKKAKQDAPTKKK